MNIAGKEYKHVKDRSYGLGSIYTDGGSFLRIGEEKLIKEELAFHKKIQRYGFPVADILAEGENQPGQYYYIETSFGDQLLADVFAEEYKEQGYVSEENFNKMLAVVSDFARAQYQTASTESSFDEFYRGIKCGDLLKEKPELAEKADEVFEKIEERLRVFPRVLTHGDLNPHNVFPKGVIDFANSYEAPFGFDIVSNLFTTYFFPESPTFEFQRRSQFSEEQRQRYMSYFDKLFKEWNLPKLSEYLSEFIIARGVWACVWMAEWPKIQTWRYGKIEKMMDAYLRDEDVTKILIE